MDADAHQSCSIALGVIEVGGCQCAVFAPSTLLRRRHTAFKAAYRDLPRIAHSEDMDCHATLAVTVFFMSSRAKRGDPFGSGKKLGK